MTKYITILLVFYLNSISPLYAEKNNRNKIDFDWFNSEEYKMIKKMQNCKVKHLDGSLEHAIHICLIGIRIYDEFD